MKYSFSNEFQRCTHFYYFSLGKVTFVCRLLPILVEKEMLAVLLFVSSTHCYIPKEWNLLWGGYLKHSKLIINPLIIYYSSLIVNV